MKFESFLKLAGALPLFDLPLLVQAFDDPRAVIRVQLSRWMKQDKVIGLRRGVYTLADRYRSVPLTPAVLANEIYRPSYLSGLWALSFYDLIPERVVWMTSVSTRPPRRFENPLGVFDYRNIKPEGFFGYRTQPYKGGDIVVANPEKALLDHWHLSHGEWTNPRLEEMRYQNLALVDGDRLRSFSQRFRSPRLDRATRRWLELAARDLISTEKL